MEKVLERCGNCGVPVVSADVRCPCSQPRGYMRTRLDGHEQLEALPDGAVVIDRNCQVWQHGIADLPPAEVTRQFGHDLWNTTKLWVKPGSSTVHFSTALVLPAYLLDDGL